MKGDRYGLPNKEKTNAKWYTLGVTKWLSVPDKPPVQNPKAQDFLVAGCLLEVLPEITEGKKKGDIKIEADRITYAVDDKTSDEIANELLGKRQFMTCTLWQFRKAINVTGKRGAVNSYLATASQDEKDGWEVASSVERLHPNIDGIKDHFNMTDEDMDNLFTLAVTL